MKNKGFTLIEVMAVVILLGVLAAVLFPIVRTTIKNNEQKSFKESLNGVYRTFEMYIAEKGLSIDATYDIEDIDLGIENEEFISGKIVFKDGKITLKNFYNGSYCGNGTKNKFSVIEGECITGSNVYTNGAVVYYNPYTKKNCSPEEISEDYYYLEDIDELSDLDSKCFRWYVYNYDDNTETYKAILDRSLFSDLGNSFNELLSESLDYLIEEFDTEVSLMSSQEFFDVVGVDKEEYVNAYNEMTEEFENIPKGDYESLTKLLTNVPQIFKDINKQPWTYENTSAFILSDGGSIMYDNDFGFNANIGYIDEPVSRFIRPVITLTTDIETADVPKAEVSLTKKAVRGNPTNEITIKFTGSKETVAYCGSRWNDTYDFDFCEPTNGKKSITHKINSYCDGKNSTLYYIFARGVDGSYSQASMVELGDMGCQFQIVKKALKKELIIEKN